MKLVICIDNTFVKDKSRTIKDLVPGSNYEVISHYTTKAGEVYYSMVINGFRRRYQAFRFIDHPLNTGK